MCNRRIVDLSALGCIERLELIRIKVGAVICDNAVRNSISEYQLLDEVDGSACTKVFDGLGFDPLGELVDCYKQMGETTRAGFEGSNHIQSLDCKRPDEWNSLQGRCGLVGHAGVELTTCALVDYIFRHLICMRPIKSRSVCFGNDGPRGFMVTTGPRVDLV